MIMTRQKSLLSGNNAIHLVALILFCLLSGVLRAQTEDVRRFEVELGLGIAASPEKLNFDNAESGYIFFAEARYNFADVPVNIGLHWSTQLIGRELEGYYKPDPTGWCMVNYNTNAIMVVSDYTFRRGKRISFFAGAGVGIANYRTQSELLIKDGYSFGSDDFNIEEHSYRVPYSEYTGICFMPRVGVEFFNHLRLTADYKIGKKGYNHFDFTLGVVIGGGRKK